MSNRNMLRNIRRELQKELKLCKKRLKIGGNLPERIHGNTNWRITRLSWFRHEYARYLDLKRLFKVAQGVENV